MPLWAIHNGRRAAARAREAQERAARERAARIASKEQQQSIRPVKRQVPRQSQPTPPRSHDTNVVFTIGVGPMTDGRAAASFRAASQGKTAGPRFVQVSYPNRVAPPPAIVSTWQVPPSDEARSKWAAASGPLSTEAELDLSSRFVQESLASWNDPPNPAAPPVSFNMYYPTYENLTPTQRAWYLFWRSEWLAGRPLYAELSYVFLCSYELLNFLIVRDKEKAYRALEALFFEYRPSFPKLDTRLPSWLGDLAWELEHREEALAWWGSVPWERAAVRALSSKQEGDTFSPERLMGRFEYPTNAHYRKYPSELRNLFLEVARDADRYCREQKGVGLENVVFPGHWHSSKPRRFFEGAVVVRRVHAPTFDLVSDDRPWYYEQRKILEEFFQAVENAHRAQHGVARQLKVEMEILPAVLRKYLRQEFGVRFPALAPAQVEGSKPKSNLPTTVDLAEARRLYSESVEFADELDALTASEESAKDQPPAPPAGANPNLVHPRSTVELGPHAPSIDLEAARQIVKISEKFVDEQSGPELMSEAEAGVEAPAEQLAEAPALAPPVLLSPAERSVLSMFKPGERIPYVELRARASRSRIMLDAALEAINEKAAAAAEDSLILEENGHLYLNPDIDPGSLLRNVKE